MRRSGAVGAGLVAIGAGLAVAGLSHLRQGRAMDRALYRAMNHGRGRRADPLFKAVTELGSLWASAAAAGVLWSRGRRRAAADALGAAVAMWGVGQLLKKATRRPRPYQTLKDVRLLIAEPSGTSWPSSHPAVLLAFATVAGRDLGSNGLAGRVPGALAGLVGWSRVHLGVHYPSDVAGGLLLGRGLADLWSGLVSPRVLAPPTEAPRAIVLR